MVSIHWGGNWGYHVPASQRRFAHRLIEGGVDIVHGHSSHHPRPIEVHHQRLILYGAGDLLNDYEGIRGYERFRPDLALLYLASADPGTGRLASPRLVPVQLARMRLGRASGMDREWLCRTLDCCSRPYGTSITAEGEHLEAHWG